VEMYDQPQRKVSRLIGSSINQPEARSGVGDGEIYKIVQQ
jgi:hypothetical protein